jgi:integration host factor subunit beta
MIRSELLQELHKDNPELRADEIEQVVDIFFDEIAQRLAEGRPGRTAWLWCLFNARA